MQQEQEQAAVVPPVLDGAACSPACSPANATTSSAMPAVGGRSLPLYTPEDNDHLSPLVCVVRCQLELFSATPVDVRARSNVRGNIAKNITVGRVGIRCVHCAAAAARGGGRRRCSGRRRQQQGQRQLPCLHPRTQSGRAELAALSLPNVSLHAAGGAGAVRKPHQRAEVCVVGTESGVLGPALLRGRARRRRGGGRGYFFRG